MAGSDLGHETVPIDMSVQEDEILFDPDRLDIVRVSPEFCDTDISIAGVTGDVGTLTSITADFSAILTGDIVLLSGFTNAGNNGKWEATGDGVAPGPSTPSTVELTKQDDDSPLDEIAGELITWKTETIFDSNLPGLLDDRFTQSGVGRYLAYIPTFASGGWAFEVRAYATLGAGPSEKEYRGSFKRTLRSNLSVQ